MEKWECDSQAEQFEQNRFPRSADLELYKEMTQSYSHTKVSSSIQIMDWKIEKGVNLLNMKSKLCFRETS